MDSVEPEILDCLLLIRLMDDDLCTSLSLETWRLYLVLFLSDEVVVLGMGAESRRLKAVLQTDLELVTSVECLRVRGLVLYCPNDLVLLL